MEVIVKCNRWLDSYGDTNMLCSLLSDDFFWIMCIASFNFNVNGVEAELVISNLFSVLSVFKYHYLQNVQKCGNFYPFPNIV